MSAFRKHFVSICKSSISRNTCFLTPLRFKNKLATVTATPKVNYNEQMEFLKCEIENNNEIHWSELKDSVLSKKGSLNQKNIDAVIMKCIVANRKFDAGLAFASYLKASDKELSLGAVNSLMNLYYEYAKENVLSNQDKEFILQAYKDLYGNYKILDYTTSEKLLHALCAIDEWKKCMKVLDDIHLTGLPSHSAYSTLIGTLFRNNKKTEALNLISKSINNNRPLQDYAYDEWIKYIFRKYKDKKVLLKHLNSLCSHICDNCIVVTGVTAQRLKESFEQLNWRGDFARIQKNSALCMSCNQKLDCLKLSEEEFSILQKNIKQRLIVGSDLMLKSSPEELKRFLDFVKATAPYDVVLDALNIAFTVDAGPQRILVLRYVVDYFNNQNKKVLLLGRKHMLKWQRGAMQNVIKRTESFFIDNISQDDPYFITAAILSGPHTDIVSRDLLRGHRFLLQQDNLEQLFQRWQWQHQWMVFAPQNKVNIQPPLKFTPLAQPSSNGWHLPHIAENPSNSQVYDFYHDCSSWLCLRSKSHK